MRDLRNATHTHSSSCQNFLKSQCALLPRPKLIKTPFVFKRASQFDIKTTALVLALQKAPKITFFIKVTLS